MKVHNTPGERVRCMTFHPAKLILNFHTANLRAVFLLSGLLGVYQFRMVLNIF